MKQVVLNLWYCTIVQRNHATEVAFRNCIPFIKCINRSDGTATDDVENVDLVMPMYNLLGNNSNHSDTTGSFWFYSKEEVTNFNNDIADTNDFKSFKYNTKLLQETEWCLKKMKS